VITILIFGGLSLPQNWREWLGAILLIPGFSSEIIYIGWTLSYEIYFYLVFAIILSLGYNMLNSVALLSALFVMLAAMGALSPSNHNVIFESLLSVLLIEFVFGAWVAILFLGVDRHARLIGYFAIFIGLFGFIAGYYMGYDKIPRVFSWGVPSLFLIMGVALLDISGFGSPISRWFVSLGDASYALYLIHPAIILIGFNVVYPILNFEFWAFLGLSCFTLIVCVLCSVLIHQFIQPWLYILRYFRVRIHKQ